MRRVIVSSCGTSVLTNGATEAVRRELNRTANDRDKDLARDFRARIEARAAEVEKTLLDADLQTVRRMSAELNGIVAIYGDRIPDDAGKDLHFLVCTDTFQGKTAARVVERWLSARGLPAQVVAIEDLRTADLEEFNLGVHRLVKWCEEALPGYRDRQWTVLFNLVGGFKAVQAYLAVLGMFYADETVYIFEASRTLIRIPRLPIRLDPEGVVSDNLKVFRRLSIEESLPAEEVRAIPGTLVEVVDDRATLSVWGELVWSRCYKREYATKLHPPPCQRLRFTEAFEKDAQRYAGSDRMVRINERIDALARYLRTGTNPRSLEFKQLRGNPRPPSTHECDAWSDLDARRIYCHFEGPVLVLDRLASHL